MPGTSLTSRLKLVDLSGVGDRDIAEFWRDDDMAGLLRPYEQKAGVEVRRATAS